MEPAKVEMMTPQRLREIAEGIDHSDDRNMDYGPELRQYADELEEAWKQAREIGHELGISAEHLSALICGIGDIYSERLEHKDKRIAELESALRETSDVLYAHHKIGHPAAIDFPGGDCPICTVTLFERIAAALNKGRE